MYERVKKTIEKYEMVRPGDRVLVGVSGGPDSIFLLNALNRLKDGLGIEIIAANLDHGIRGAASRKDSLFVKAVASRMGISCYQKKLKNAGRANRKLSTEENLREARYSFFKEAASGSNANIIATGHTFDDNAETVLMRIIKGTSLKGLAGIPPVRPDGSVKIVRPLIDMKKDNILRFLKEQKISYRIDGTNNKNVFFRNKIRKNLIPCLRKYNPQIESALVNMAESAREDLEFLNNELSTRKNVIKKDRHVFIRLKDLVVQPKALQREILKDALTNSGANIKKLSYNHWKEMRNFLRHKRKGQSMDLPGDIRITRTEEAIVFKPRN